MHCKSLIIANSQVFFSTLSVWCYTPCYTPDCTRLRLFAHTANPAVLQGKARLSFSQEPNSRWAGTHASWWPTADCCGKDSETVCQESCLRRAAARVPLLSHGLCAARPPGRPCANPHWGKALPVPAMFHELQPQVFSHVSRADPAQRAGQPQVWRLHAGVHHSVSP